MEDKKIFSIIFGLIVLSLFIIGCTEKQTDVIEESSEGFQESINQANSTDFNQQETSTEVETLEKDLSNW
ncbi:MAG: hypothetical protein AABW92_01980 [Nanoarchaeota archaeon]